METRLSFQAPILNFKADKWQYARFRFIAKGGGREAFEVLTVAGTGYFTDPLPSINKTFRSCAEISSVEMLFLSGISEHVDARSDEDISADDASERKRVDESKRVEAQKAKALAAANARAAELRR
jgi:hypothetical protein